MFNVDQLDRWYQESDGPFYLVDPEKIARNYNGLLNPIREKHPSSVIAYSYKTNYSPYVCSYLHGLGAMAEVVSEMEFEFARRLGVPYSRIIVNGPLHDRAFVERCLESEACFNADSVRLLDVVAEAAKGSPKKEFRVGLRFNFPVADGGCSRFGIPAGEANIAQILEILKATPNLSVASLHCHFSTSLRSLDSFRSRVNQLVDIYEAHFKDQPVQFLNVGGGFFSRMPDSLREQFSGDVPTLEQYGETLGEVVGKRLAGTTLTFVIEPGTAIVADSACYVARVADVKDVFGRNYALIEGSVHTIKPTMNSKNLPFYVVGPGSEGEARTCDIVGYTCMESDIINRDVSVAMAAGDYAVFENVGGYTNVFKPPFIKAHPPMYALEGGNLRLIKRAETADDVLATYVQP